MTEQPQTPEQQEATAQQPSPSPSAWEPEAPVAPPAPSGPPSAPTAVTPTPPPAAAADGSPPSGFAYERPEVLAGAAFAGGFLVALILKRLGS